MPGKAYQHVVVGIMPGVVEFLHGLLKPAEVLHGAARAAAVNHHLPILADAASGFGKVGKVPPVHKALQPPQVGIAAIKFDDPSQLR